MNFGQLYFSFDGRIDRQTYWLKGVLPFWAMTFFVGIFDEAIGADGGLIAICFLLAALPSLAFQAKRWHDRNKSGWWALINLIPLVGPIWSLVELGFLPGNPGRNRFDLPPTIQQPKETPVNNIILPAPTLPPTNNGTANTKPTQGEPMKDIFAAANQLKENGLLSDDEFDIVHQRISSKAQTKRPAHVPS